MPRSRVFRDPVHESIEFDLDYAPERLALDLLDTPQVQRLKHVRQLPFASFVYHGAEHSRFSHTVGVTNVAKRLYRAATHALGYPNHPVEYAIVLAAAVLHDVGHLPFSHAMEKPLGIEHERISEAVVRETGRVNDLLAGYGGPSFINAVSHHIANATDARTVSVISSQLDADRMDYVLRDGYFAGVPNSRYDIARIIHMTRIDDDGLLFDARAQRAIEGFFMARYHLYIQLYLHKTVRSAEALMRAIFQRAKWLSAQSVDLGDVSRAIEAVFVPNPTTETVLRLTDHELWAAFRTWSTSSSDGVLQDLSQRLVERRLFKVWEVPADLPPTFIEAALPQLEELVLGKGMDPEYYALHDLATDTPYKAPNPAERTRSARLIDRNSEEVWDLETSSGPHSSPVIAALKGAGYSVHRFCFPSDVRDDARELLDNAARGARAK